MIRKFASKFDTLTKGLVCTRCGSTKWIPKLGGAVCSSCSSFVDYVNIKTLKETTDK